MKRLQYFLYQILRVEEGPSRGLSFYFDVVLMSLILLNVLAIVLESVDSIYTPYKPWFQAFDLLSIVFFSAEYLLRVWTITCDPRYSHPVWGRLRYMFSFMALVDLLAILPFYVEGIVHLLGGARALGIDMRFLRILRVFRIVRLLKVVRYVSALRIIGNVFRSKKEELIISLVFILFILLIVSCMMYFVEHEAQPDQFSSIPATMWWGVATLTTVGYGDIYPITPMGKALGGVIAILGIGLFALPAGILAAGCADELQHHHRRQAAAGKECPHCGRPFDEH
ncbi:MAG: ion transporter [Bacteroidetes bacterium]|nr:MAG: ion transporter [Bacteroidota bacterium]